MGTIEPRTIVLKDGRTGVIRSAVWTDAAQLLEHFDDIWRTANEFSVTDPAERERTLAQEVEEIESHREKPNLLMLVSEVEGVVCAGLTFRGGHRARIAHHGPFGIAVSSGYRELGVGRALIAALLEWARAHPTIERVDLGVFDNNPRAMHLYRSMGFVEVSRRAREFKLAPGVYVGDVQMSLWVKPPEDGPGA